MVTRVRVSSRQDVDRGTPLFEYLPEGHWAVLAYGSMTTPGGAAEPPPAEPEWSRAINQQRLARAEALLHWSTRVFSHLERPLVGERLLQQRLNVRVPREDDLALAEARAAENARLGRHEANLVRVFDQALGVFRGTEDGEPFPSDAARDWSIRCSGSSRFLRPRSARLPGGPPPSRRLERAWSPS
jgi:hypothetical protein